MIKTLFFFLDLGEGNDHKALVFGPEKPRKSWKTAMMRPRSSQPLRIAKKLQKSQRQGPRTRLKRDLCRKRCLTPQNRSICRFSPTHFTSFFLSFSVWSTGLNAVRIVEDSPPGDKNHENREGFGVPQGGQSNGRKKKTKKETSKKEAVPPLHFALPYFTPHFLNWESHPHHKRERERGGRKEPPPHRERLEKTANAAPNREGESAIVPSFCCGSVSLSFFLW